jgi:hypothetical protein
MLINTKIALSAVMILTAATSATLASFCRETPGLNGLDSSYLGGLCTKCQ